MNSMNSEGFRSSLSRLLSWALGGLCALTLLSVFPRAEQKDEAGETKAREVVQSGIAALGGPKYLEIENTHHLGRYFRFGKRGLSGFARYRDWTVFEPIKSRFQYGEGKRQEVTIYNLELRKAWKLKGEDTVEEIPEEEIRKFETMVKRDVNVLLRTRLNEKGLHLYYYGPDDISGTGNYEAVEFLDVENNSVVVYFDLSTHLPTRVNSERRDPEGVLHKIEEEFLNWHTIEGVRTPLRIDSYSDGKLSQQYHVEELFYNVEIPPQHFLEPKVEEED
jgi:hypothetical protein